VAAWLRRAAREDGAFIHTFELKMRRFPAPLVLRLVVLFASSSSACGGCVGTARSNDEEAMQLFDAVDFGDVFEDSRPFLDAAAIKEAVTSKLVRLLSLSITGDLSRTADTSTSLVATDVVPSTHDRGVVVAKFTQYLDGLPVEGASLAMHINTRDGAVVALEGKLHPVSIDSSLPSRVDGCEVAVEAAFETLTQRRGRSGVWSSPCDDAAVVGDDGTAHLAYKRVRRYDGVDGGSDAIFASRLDGSLVAVHPQNTAQVTSEQRHLSIIDPDVCALERGMECNQTIGCFSTCNNTCDGPKGTIPTCKVCREIGKTCARSTQCCQRGSFRLSCQNNFCWPANFLCPAGPHQSPLNITTSQQIATAKSGSTCQSRADCCDGSAGQFQLTCDGNSSTNKKCVVCKAAKQGPCVRSSQCCKGLTCKSKKCVS
jgi:Fungalysin/Thermolysin Propeptide Motif